MSFLTSLELIVQALQFSNSCDTFKFGDFLKPISILQKWYGYPMEYAKKEKTVTSNNSFGSSAEITSVLLEVRDALTNMMSATGSDPSKTRATARLLDLDRNLIWKVIKVINSDDVIEVSQAIPSLATVEKIGRACGRSGVPAILIEHALTAVKKYEHMVKVSAGDRTNFEVMLSALEHGDVTSRQESARKLSYLGNSTIWGIQARVSFKTFLITPSPGTDGMLDLAVLGGFVGLRRLRSVTWPVYRDELYDDHGNPVQQVSLPIDPRQATVDSPPFLTDFCSIPLPEVSTYRKGLVTRYDLAPGPIGNAGIGSCIFGRIKPQCVSLYRDEVNTVGSFGVDLETPTELVIADLFRHRSFPSTLPPDVFLLDRMTVPRGHDLSVDQHHRLPLTSKATRLGPGHLGSATPQFPRYPEMLKYAFSQLEWEADDFIGYRFTMQYPPCPAAILLQFPLLDPPVAD